MDDLTKTEQLNLRISPIQKAWLAEAAEVVSREKGALVPVSTLALDLLMEAVEAIRLRALRAEQAA